MPWVAVWVLLCGVGIAATAGLNAASTPDQRPEGPVSPECAEYIADIEGQLAEAKQQGTGDGVLSFSRSKVGEGPGAGQQELLQDDELLPHEDELLPQVDELPHDEEPPPEQSLEECSLAPASHQEGWSTGLPETCAVVALYVPAPVGHAPWPGPALEPDPVARMLRSSQARRHARRTIQVITDTSATTNTPAHTNAINMTSPPPPGGCTRIARSMPGDALTGSTS
ncbi:hypothetical protein ACFWHV_38910 [Streptomyces collinus]|uniref:hypothetical protein n=1 Tax=Streptomyces collinus TaxID=42684 RepID=UPI003655CC2A